MTTSTYHTPHQIVWSTDCPGEQRSNIISYIIYGIYFFFLNHSSSYNICLFLCAACSVCWDVSLDFGKLCFCFSAFRLCTAFFYGFHPNKQIMDFVSFDIQMVHDNAHTAQRNQTKLQPARHKKKMSTE